MPSLSESLLASDELEDELEELTDELDELEELLAVQPPGLSIEMTETASC